MCLMYLLWNKFTHDKLALYLAFNRATPTYRFKIGIRIGIGIGIGIGSVETVLHIIILAISVADLREARGTRAPLGAQILSISCSFWEILAKSYVGPPLGSWRPLLREILDPPLHLNQNQNRNRHRNQSRAVETHHNRTCGILAP